MKEASFKSILDRVCGLAVVIALALTFALTGCASDNSSKDSDKKAESTEQQASSEQQAAEEQTPETITVNMTVTDLDGNLLDEATVKVTPESTAFNVLEQSGVEFVSGTGQYGVYVTSIDGLAATDNSGWTYMLNGEQPPVGADQQVVVDGDTIAWQYTAW